MADDLGVKVVEEELLSEKSHNGAETAAQRRLLEIVADGGVPVACSQGGVIPDLVSRLAAASGLPLDARRARRAAYGPCSSTRTGSVAADYIAVP